MNDPRLLEAVELFNSEEFFACHDVLEEIWSETLDESREFYQGLIHAAVALFHFSEGNLGGARKIHDSAIRYLAPFGDAYRGVELKTFRAEFNDCFANLLHVTTGYPQGVTIDPARIPKLVIHPSGP